MLLKLILKKKYLLNKTKKNQTEKQLNNKAIKHLINIEFRVLKSLIDCFLFYFTLKGKQSKQKFNTIRAYKLNSIQFGRKCNKTREGTYLFTHAFGFFLSLSRTLNRCTVYLNVYVILIYAYKKYHSYYLLLPAHNNLSRVNLFVFTHVHKSTYTRA